LETFKSQLCPNYAVFFVKADNLAVQNGVIRLQKQFNGRAEIGKTSEPIALSRNQPHTGSPSSLAQLRHGVWMGVPGK